MRSSYNLVLPFSTLETYSLYFQLNIFQCQYFVRKYILKSKLSNKCTSSFCALNWRICELSVWGRYERQKVLINKPLSFKNSLIESNTSLKQSSNMHLIQWFLMIESMGILRHPISRFLAVCNNWYCVSQIHQRTPFCKFLYSAAAELPEGSGDTGGEMFITSFIYWRKQLSHLGGGSQRHSETRINPLALDLKSPKLACSFICLSLCTEQHDHCLPPKPQLPAGDKQEAPCSRGEGRGGCLHWPSLPEVYAGGTTKMLKGRISCLTGDLLNLGLAVFLPCRVRDFPPLSSSTGFSLVEAELISWLALGNPMKC